MRHNTKWLVLIIAKPQNLSRSQKFTPAKISSRPFKITWFIMESILERKWQHPGLMTSVAPIHEFADIPIHRYLFYNTADTDTDTDVFIINFFY